MTVAAASPETTHPLEGANLGPFETTWVYEFADEVAAFLVVGVEVTTLVRNVDFTVSGGSPLVDGGAVTLLAGVLPEGGEWAEGTSLVLRRRTRLAQPTPFKDFESWRPATGEAAWDRLTRAVQDLRVGQGGVGIGGAVDLPAVVEAVVSALTAEVLTAALGYTPQDIAQKGQANGYAGLNGSGKVPTAQLPALTSGDVIGALTYTPQNAAAKGQPNGYASLGSDGKVPSGQLPTSGGGGGAPAAGFYEVARSPNPNNGRLDLTAWDGRTVLLTTGPDGDDNIFEIVGLEVGHEVTLKVDRNYGFLLIPPGFYTGDCKLVGNYQAVATGHDGLSVGPDDTLKIIRRKDAEGKRVYEIFLANNQFESRVNWAGTSREPLETYHAMGMVGPFNAKLSAITGDGLQPVNGTARKGYSGGHYYIGIGDSAGVFWTVLDALDAEVGEGLNGPPRLGVPHTDINKLSTHFATLRMLVYGADGETLEQAGAVPPDGWITGPGSILNQGWAAQFHFHGQTIPTRQSCPGGASIRVTPEGMSTVIARLIASSNGGIVHLGKGALEAAGTIAELAPGLNTGNIGQWNIPSLAWDARDDASANQHVLLTPAEEGGAVEHFSGTAWRYWNAPGNGVDLYWRSDEEMVWLGSTWGGLRQRGFGFYSDLPGVFIGGENAEDWHQVQTARVQIADGASKVFNLRPGQFGWVRIALDNGFSADFNVSAAQNLTRLHAQTAGGPTWADNSSPGAICVYISGGDLVIQNRSGSTRNLYVTLNH